MHNLLLLKKIGPNKIQDGDKWNLHPFLGSDPPASLCSSISRHGILHPPILIKTTGDNYEVISGRFRLRAFRHIHPNVQSIPCYVLKEETKPVEILTLALEEQLLSCELSPMEKAYFFKCAFQHLEAHDINKCVQVVLGETIHDHRIKKYLTLLKLEDELQTSVHLGAINEKLAYDLINLERDDRQLLHHLFLTLGLGGGKQKRLLALASDIARREETSIFSLLQENEFRDTLEHPEMNPPQKGAILLSQLQKKAYPESSVAEEVFARKVKRMELPKGCSISHSQAFERDELYITLRFKDLPSVEKQLAKIREILQ